MYYQKWNLGSTQNPTSIPKWFRQKILILTAIRVSEDTKQKWVLEEILPTTTKKMFLIIE